MLETTYAAEEPTATAKEMMQRLAEMMPDAYATKTQLRTLQRRVKRWRAEKAKDLILGRLRQVTSIEHNRPGSEATSRSHQEEATPQLR